MPYHMDLSENQIMWWKPPEKRLLLFLWLLELPREIAGRPFQLISFECFTSHLSAPFSYSESATFFIICKSVHVNKECAIKPRLYTPLRQVNKQYTNDSRHHTQSIPKSIWMAFFMVNFSHLHYNKIWHVCEAVSGCSVVLARNCLAFTLDYIVTQMSKVNHEKGWIEYSIWNRASRPFCTALLLKADSLTSATQER